MTSTPDPAARLTVRDPADLLAAVPYVLGFHPRDSLVVVAVRERRVTFAVRADLPAPAAAPVELAAAARGIATTVAGQGATGATVIGYGEPERLAPVVAPVRTELERRGVPVLEALRATAGRFWSYLCEDPACCPAGGTAYDLAASPVTAAATYAGQVALPDRAALAALVAPVGGLTRVSMRQATERAEARLVALLADAPSPDVLGGRALREAGLRAVAAAVSRAARGGRPSDDEVAWLSLLLAHVPVRDAAWERTAGEQWELDLWGDVVRRAEPDLVPAPASLLAFTAWRAGQGALANVAVDRALREDPDYSMARLIRETLDGGVPPSALPAWPPVGGRAGRAARRHAGRERAGRRARRSTGRRGVTG